MRENRGKNVYVILFQTKTFVVGRNLTPIQVLMNVNRLVSYKNKILFEAFLNPICIYLFPGMNDLATLIVPL